MAIGDWNTDYLIHNSDKGVQSHDYTDLLNSCGIAISMSAKGSPYDNAVIESFFKTLNTTQKRYIREYKTYDDVTKKTPYFIEDVTWGIWGYIY